jgi:hypothetical protein
MFRFRLFCDCRTLQSSCWGAPFLTKDGSVIYSYNLLSLFGPSPAELTTTSYCLISDHMLLSHTRLPQPGRPGSCIYSYIPQEQSVPVIPLGTGFPFCRLVGLAGLRWRYSNPQEQVKVKVTLRPTISRPVRLGVRRPSGTRDQFFVLLEFFLGLIIDVSSFERTQRKMSPAPSLEEGTRSRFQNVVCFSVL